MRGSHNIFHFLVLIVFYASSSVHSLQIAALPRSSNNLPATHAPARIILQGGANQDTTNEFRRTSVSLTSTTPSALSSGGDDEKKRLDVGAVGKYVLALATQMSLITGLFAGLDKLLLVSNKYGIITNQVPFAVNFILFYFFALKSRFLNPLSNRRPQPRTKELDTVQEQRKMPAWTPPGFIFPIVWLLLIGPLRAATSAMVYKASGGIYASKAILSLMLHLSIGDVWNTINNVERRYGTSVLGVLCVWISAAFAARQYYQVLPLAGRLLSLKMIWLTIASSLIVRTWQINPDPKTGKPYSLLPLTGDATTTLIWFEGEEKDE